MDTFSIIIAVVTLIVSILQIILFFKIWKMTDDVLSLKETVNKLLYINKIPEEKRIYNACIEAFEELWFKKAINTNLLPTSEPERSEELNKQVGFIFAREKHNTNRVLEKYVVNGVYTIEQLQRDIVNEYKKKIAELLENSE